MTEAPPTLEVRNVSVTRGGRRVLDGVSVAVAPGEIVVAVGPNGAGKTTLLDTVIGAVPANGGGCFVGARAFGGLKDRARWLGYLAGEAEPPPEVRVDVLLDDAAERCDEASWARALEVQLGLRELRGATVGALSRGERRRVLLFEALAARKPFLLLDEPTGVFDPLQLLDIIDLLRQTAARGTGLLMTVHQMSDAEVLASRVLVLNEGRVVSLGSMAELRTQAGVAASMSLQETFLALLRAEPARNGGKAP
jgi:ABC-type multidrug transport system ATPase subunit